MQAKLEWVENDEEDAFLEQMLTTANGWSLHKFK